MEKEKFLPYLELCRHYFNDVDKFSKVKVPLDEVEFTIYQKDLMSAALNLVCYSHALYDSILNSCADNLLSGKKFYYASNFDISSFNAT